MLGQGGNKTEHAWIVRHGMGLEREGQDRELDQGTVSTKKRTGQGQGQGQEQEHGQNRVGQDKTRQGIPTAPSPPHAFSKQSGRSFDESSGQFFEF